MAHDVVCVELDELEIVDVHEDIAHGEPGTSAPFRGDRSGYIAGDDDLRSTEAVRNIFICSGVVFSSR
jgi:hypothetical protein